MMSSSRIIKSVQQDVSNISDFNFRQIGQSTALPVAEKRSTGFIPMGILTEAGEFKPYNDAPEEEPVEIGPPVIEITEDDLNQRISDAFNSGLKEGKELAERGLTNVFRALRVSSEAIHDLREKVLRESEDELVNLIMMVARKVITREISQDRSILAGVVHNAIAALSEREEVIVRINPDDYVLTTTGREEYLQKELFSERLQLRPDPTVPAGFCQIDTVMGTIDASMDAQLEEIYRHLLEQRTKATIEGN